MEKIKRDTIDLIESLHFVWTSLQHITSNPNGEEEKIFTSWETILKAFDVIGIPRDDYAQMLEREGVIYCLLLIAFIYKFQRRGVTLRDLINEYKDVLKDSKSHYFRKYIKPQFQDLFEG